MHVVVRILLEILLQCRPELQLLLLDAYVQWKLAALGINDFIVHTFPHTKSSFEALSVQHFNLLRLPTNRLILEAKGVKKR